MEIDVPPTRLPQPGDIRRPVCSDLMAAGQII